jgi:hypothetical protein
LRIIVRIPACEAVPERQTMTTYGSPEQAISQVKSLLEA